LKKKKIFVKRNGHDSAKGTAPIRKLPFKRDGLFELGKEGKRRDDLPQWKRFGDERSLTVS